MKALLVLALLFPACRAGAGDLTIRANGADENAPLIVWLHGRGGSPEVFTDWWRTFPGRAEIALPRGPIRQGAGFAWYGAQANDEEQGRALLDAADRLWASIEKIAHGRKVIVGGFSQGAVMTYALLLRHSDRVIAAFPVAGALPHTIWPPPNAPLPPIHHFHGKSDDTVPMDWGQATAQAFHAQFTEFDGGHKLPPEIRATVFSEIQSALK